MDKPIVYLDLDNTLFGLMETILIKYNIKYGDNLTIDNFKDYDVTKYIKLECKHLFEEFANEDTFQKMKPYQGVVEAVKYLNSKYQVYYASSGHPRTQWYRDDMLEKWFPSYKSKQLIMIRDKYLLRGDVLVDDHVENLRSGQYQRVVYTAPWNKDFDEEEISAKRVTGWENNTLTIIEKAIQKSCEKRKRKKECEKRRR